MACAARRNPPVHQPSCWFVVGKSATHEGRMRVGKRCLGDVNSPNSSTTNFLSAGCTRLSTISVSCAGSHAPGFSSPKMSTSGILIGSSSTANASRTISTAAHETSLSTCPWNVNRCSGSAKLSEFGSAAQVDEALCDGTAYARNANLPQDEDSEYCGAQPCVSSDCVLSSRSRRLAFCAALFVTSRLVALLSEGVPS